MMLAKVTPLTADKLMGLYLKSHASLSNSHHLYKAASNIRPGVLYRLAMQRNGGSGDIRATSGAKRKKRMKRNEWVAVGYCRVAREPGGA
ncbi:unnamed protein product [Soboliphyme baturini]|uniref:60S ribosomal protein L35a n=1 Tax=Soboliphyme baturini TaxID=241478 RepID=A0A183IEY5_9BILA|nr:unnamed protein product [Soboliphyme baturini]